MIALQFDCVSEPVQVQIATFLEYSKWIIQVIENDSQLQKSEKYRPKTHFS
jgi:hypothetical protein